MEPKSFTSKKLNVTLIVQPFTERLHVAYTRAWRTYKPVDVPDKDMTRAENTCTMVKAALACGWIATEPPMTLEDVDQASPKLINWIADGRGEDSLTAIYIDAITIPKD